MQNLTNCACTGKTLPKLLRPIILSVLASGDFHGYAITERLGHLAFFADQPPDYTGVYRRFSRWKRRASSCRTGSIRGPARANAATA